MVKRKSRLNKTLFKKATLELIDKETQEENKVLYESKKSDLADVANTMTQEDLFSTYDEDGVKIEEAKPIQQEESIDIVSILLIFIFIMVVICTLYILATG
jgi:hypothetical protein